jgi:hypothetical protein
VTYGRARPAAPNGERVGRRRDRHYRQGATTMATPETRAYAVGQRVRSLSSYHRGDLGTVIARHPGDRPAYVVECAGGACAFLRADEGVDG